MQLVTAVALTLVLRAGPDAPPAPRPSAAEEVDALLAATTSKSPSAEVLVVVSGPDPKLYRLEDATVRLDGAPLAPYFSGTAGPAPKGTPVSDGDHVVSARLVYRGAPLGPYPWEEGPKWTLPVRVMLTASRGLRLTIRLLVEANAETRVVSQRLGLRSDVEPEMLAVVDDAPLPPPPLPKLPPVTPAAVPLAASSTALSAGTTTAPAVAPVVKKKKSKVAHAKRPSTVVPAAAAASTTAPLPVTESPDALEQATARLRTALASPKDGGVAPSGSAPR